MALQIQGPTYCVEVSNVIHARTLAFELVTLGVSFYSELKLGDNWTFDVHPNDAHTLDRAARKAVPSPSWRVLEAG